MPTTSVFNGTNLILTVEGATLGHTTSCSLSLSNDLPEATTKDSNGLQEVIAGVISGEISFDGLGRHLMVLAYYCPISLPVFTVVSPKKLVGHRNSV